MVRPALSVRSLGTKLLALLCSALLACTTVRTHVSAIAPEVVLREGHAALQLDLWVESNRPLTPEEEIRYRAEARQALEQALAGRTQAGGEGALVIRSLGVSRTPGRRGDQTAAGVGIAVGVVVIIVVAIVGLADGKGGGGGKSSVKAPSGGRLSGSGVPRVRSGIPASRAPGFRSPPRFPRVPAPSGGHPRVRAPVAERFPGVHRGPAVDVTVGIGWLVPIGPEPEPALPPDEGLPPGPPAALDEEDAPPPPDAEAAVTAPDPKVITLEVPEPVPVEERGFFDGDRLVLDAVIVDPATGEVLWTKRIARKADPRDAKAVRAAVDELLSDGGWTASAPPGS